MSEFKVGDKVRVVKETYECTGVHIGKEGEVTWIDDDGNCSVGVRGLSAAYTHASKGLELVDQPLEVGDKIKIKGVNTGCLTEGKVYEVVGVDRENDPIVINDNGYQWIICTTPYERVTEPDIKLKNGQIWEINSQEEFDAFIKLKDEQNVGWVLRPWVYETLMSHTAKRLEVYRHGIRFEIGNCDNSPTHYAKDLLKGDKKMEPKLLHEYKNIGSDNDTLEVWNIDGELRFKRGCFPQGERKGTIKEFELAVERTHGDNEHGQKYKAIIEALKLEHPELIEEEKQWCLELDLPIVGDSNGYIYLNKKISTGDFELGSKAEIGNYQTIFTDSEIEQMDITGFKKVPVHE